VDAKEERHPEGSYYIEWRQDGKRVRLSVGKDAQEANARRLLKQAELNAVNNGVAVVAQDGQQNGHSLTAAIADYLDETKLTKKSKTLAAYTTALEYFAECCHRLTVQEITRKDMLTFAAFLRDEKEQSPRSCWNKFANVMSFLKAQGIRGLQVPLVFPTSGCKPKLDFLDCLKAVAQRAKLKPEGFWLHKFRATFATWSLWAGVDLRTVQQWLGHSDLESTMRYLKPSRSQQVRGKVNEIFG
jgi:site-specific recombinase XerD